MKIKILGTRGEIESQAPRHTKYSGVLIDKTLLLDIGEKEYLKYHPQYIFVTHLHPDHAFFIRKPAKISIPVYAPELPQEKLPNFFLVAHKTKINSYQITPIPTYHSKKVKSVAYLVQKQRQRILYTGDLIWINKKYHPLLKNLDLVITEASFIRQSGLIRQDKKTGEIFGHTGVPNLIQLFKKFTKCILFTHFGTWFFRELKKIQPLLTKLGKNNNLKIIIGYDGLKFDLNEILKSG